MEELRRLTLTVGTRVNIFAVTFIDIKVSAYVAQVPECSETLSLRKRFIIRSLLWRHSGAWSDLFG